MFSQNDLSQLVFYLLVLMLLVAPLGYYMARVYEGESCGLTWLFRPIERLFYRCAGVDPKQEMTWLQYALAMLVFNLLGFLAVYALQRCQAFLPLNPQHFANISPDLAFNTAASFVSNTNWQAYSGETMMSYFTQMMAFTVQNFVSAATGMAILMAFIRGLLRHETTFLGNFWVDLVRTTLYILLPLAFILALILSSQGVLQNFHEEKTVQLREPTATLSTQTLPMGPVASQVAIKQLGTNGGGFFNTNSAHPFENPSPLSNFFEMLALLLIPAALCYTFGRMAKDTRQGWALFSAMLLLFLPLALMTILAEQHGSPLLTQLGLNTHLGNMEGKEIRFGVVNSGLWATATTAVSNGSVNAMLDSFTPLGGLIPLWLMQLGEVVFGGVGSGLYGMLVIVILTVFIMGLMVGRSPEYLGKKIEPYEMKLAALIILIMPVMTLVSTAISAVTASGVAALGNPGAHGFSEMLYAFSSMANNNGSAFAGLSANTPFYNLLGGFAMLMGRYWIAISVLALAGALAKKKIVASTAGTLPTHTPLFVCLLVGIIIVLGALTFLPALALGPLVEQLQMWGH